MSIGFYCKDSDEQQERRRRCFDEEGKEDAINSDLVR